MSDIPIRVYNIARASLDAAKGRLEEIDLRAQEELSRSLNRSDVAIPDPPPASSNDPMERARAKIAAAQRMAGDRREFSGSQNEADASATSPANSDPVRTAYKIIGVPVGSDYLAVQKAVAKLRERCSPARFAAGSDEQAEAQVIGQRVDEAFRVLQDALDPAAGRFDKLEL